MPFCTECGAEHAPNETFCGECGIALKQVLASIISAQAAETVVSSSNDIPVSEQNLVPEQPENNVSEPIVKSPQETENPVIESDENKGINDFAVTNPQGNGEQPQIPVQQVTSDSKVSTEDISNESGQPKQKDKTPESVNQNIGEPSVLIPSFEAIDPLKPVEQTPVAQQVHLSPVIQNAQVRTPPVEVKAEPPIAAERTSPRVMVEPDSRQQPVVAKPEERGRVQQPVISVVNKPEEKPQQKPIEVRPQEIKSETKEQESRIPQPKQSVEQEVSQAFSALINKDTGDKRRPMRQLREGTILYNRYEIVKRIGGGGMGAVYLAKDRNLGGAPRAVKEMLQSHLDESQQIKAVDDFKRESLLLTSLEHISIPTIYDYFYDEFAARFYLVMKYISGGDIAAHLRNAPGGRVDELTAARWGMETADVLYYLHNQQPPIIYRDLKPANLMVDGNSGRIMLIDFGIARWVNKEEKGVTAVGTMGYAPPELFSGKVEPRSDVYSLGATLFHLLTGTDPQDNPLLIFDFTKNATPRQLNPAMSVEMEAILMRSVEYKPENRFRSAAELRDVLRFHLDKLARGELTYTPITARTDTAPSVEMVFCGFCGGSIAADDLFCAHCGKAQPLSGVGNASSTLRPRATAKLVVAGTTEIVASEFALQKDTNLIGRSDPQSNIFPEVDLTRYDPDTKVSRRHARIWRQGDTYLVEDLGSVNGTVVFNRSDKPMRLSPHQPHILQSGDRLRLGETLLHFFAG